MSEQRRRFLVMIVGGMGITAVALFGLALVRSIPTEQPGPRPSAERIYVGGLAPGEFRLADWRGRQLLILRRTPAMLATLTANRNALEDPDSKRSQQPPGAANPYRSLHPELFVGLAYGTGMGCPVDFLPAGAAVGLQRWTGGFRDRCDGSVYDMAGRVYRDQPAKKNLVIPPYRRADADHIELENPK